MGCSVPLSFHHFDDFKFNFYWLFYTTNYQTAKSEISVARIGHHFIILKWKKKLPGLLSSTSKLGMDFWISESSP